MAPLKKHQNVLLALAKAKPKLVRKIIRPAKRDLIDALSECSLNIVRGAVPLTAARKNKLRRYKTGLRNLAKKGVSVKKKKAILQKGGFIGALLSAVLPLAFQGIAGAITRKNKKKKKSK